MALKTKIYLNRKSVFDLTAELYGSLSYVFNILNDNADLFTDVNDICSVGDSIIYDDSISFVNATKTVTKDVTQSPIVKSVRIMNNQTIFDMALQVYGSIEGTLNLLQRNSDLGSINNSAIEGINLIYTEQTSSVPAFYKKNGIFIQTGAKANATEFESSFDLSFDLSFL